VSQAQNVSSPACHLKALAIATGLLALALYYSPLLFRAILRPMMRNLIALPSPEKNQGMFLQHEAFLRPDVMPVYGSSELTVEMDKRAGDFFRWKSKGFQVCPVGAAGNTTFLMAQKIAAQGTAVRDHKVAVILSSTWFRRAEVPKAHMAGNFSPLQAIELFHTPALDSSLRRRFAARLIDFADVLDDHALLNAFTHDVAANQTDGMRHVLLRKALWGWGEVLSWEDQLDTVAMALDYRSADLKTWSTRPNPTPLHRIIKKMEREEPDEDDPALLTPAPPLVQGGARDEEYLATMSASREWDDFALLLDTLKKLKADALIISVPLPGVSSEKHGLSRAARSYFYRRVENMSVEHGFHVQTFSDHDLDQGFIVGATTHLTTKGWIYVDQVLDAFYHDRLPPARIRG
jgi:D-alanine transfer protein